MNIFKKSAVTFYAGVRGQPHMNNTTMKHFTNGLQRLPIKKFIESMNVFQSRKSTN